MYRSLGSLSTLLAEIPWPVDFFSPDDLPTFLNSIFVLDYQLREREVGFSSQFWLAFEGELAVALPGLDGVKLVIGSNVPGFTFITVSLIVGTQSVLTLDNIQIALRFDPSILKPAALNDGDPVAEFVEIQVAGSLSINNSFDITVQGFDALKLTPAMIGNSGVIIAADDVKLDLSRTTNIPEVTAAGFDASFMGVYIGQAQVKLPEGLPALAPEDLFLRNCAIGSGGVSGQLEAHYSPTYDSNTKTFTGKGAGTLFGIPFGLKDVLLSFKQNTFQASQMSGSLLLPFFDEPVDIVIGINLDGSLTVKLTSANGLYTLTKPGVLSMQLQSIGFVIAGGVFITKLSGQITPLFGPPGLNWPSFQVKELAIDSKGNIHLQGGWLNLPNQYHLDFYGFHMEITKLGFGNTVDGGKWIGFSGGIKLVDGMPAGASVEGLRLIWYDDGSGRSPQITLNGVGVELSVPGLLAFKGAVSYQSDKQEFHGSITLNLLALNMEVDGTAVFGSRPGYTYLALYLATELPAGIPLWATGLGLYGIAGLFALDMKPNRSPNQPWYAINSTTDWYHSSPGVGVTNLAKWINQADSTALGAGITIGTVSDNGHAFSGKLLLVILFPGPTLLIQGSASLLQSRATLDKDANFRALGVIDTRAGTFLMGLDARYQYDSAGRLITIRGGAEAFFSLSDAHAWHLYLGEKDPPEKRIRAQLFQLFTANSYLMLDAHQLALGAWVGYNQHWTFGPLSVTLEAWIDGNALVSWKPVHFHGDLWLHGSAQLSAFGFGVGLTVDARIAADVFNPFHILGQFSVGIHLPWPFSDINVGITLQWGPQATPPPLPLPLKEIAIEHFKTTTSWPLPRISRNGNQPLLLPNYDSNGDGFLTNPIGVSEPSDLTKLPLVPVDCRPHLTFGRVVNDDALVGVNVQPVVPEWELIGDPTRNDNLVQVRYGLQGVALEKRVGSSWVAVAQTPPATPGGPKLYGSWAPVPSPSGGGPNPGQVKLWLWSKTAFDYTRHTGGTWSQWFTDRFSGYPCGPLLQDCWDFEQIAPIQQLPDPWQYPAQPNLVFSGDGSGGMSLAVQNQPVKGLSHALCFSTLFGIRIDLPEPVNVAKILTQYSPLIAFSGYDAQGNKYGPFSAASRDDPTVEIRGGNMVRLGVEYSVSNSTPVTLTSGFSIGGAIGCAYIPPRNQLVFVDFNGGKISAIDLGNNQCTVLGTGYTNPEDIVVTADGTTAYVTERAGNLLRVDLTPGKSDRSNAVIISQGMTAPQQIALDEANGQAYIVEYASSGRLLRIDLGGDILGRQTVLFSGLNNAVGLLMAPDSSAAYVSEQGSGGQLSRITLGTSTRQVLFNGLTSPFFMRWANASNTRILLALRDPANSVILLDLVHSPVASTTVVSGVPFRPSSITVLPDNRLVVCSDSVVSAYDLKVCVLDICLVKADVLIQHFEDELARWSQAGEVLEPYTTYRLKVTTTIQARGQRELAWYSRSGPPLTEYAYFCTGGPPGVASLSTPIGYPTGTAFESGLDDLTRYVRQAAATPGTGGYNIGVEFNENYVDLLYRLAWRDLGIHLYDNNGPVRDAQGRVLVLSNDWGRAEQLTLTESEESWLAVLSQSGCAFVDPMTILHNTTLLSSTGSQALASQTLYDARLVPLLLHEDFSRYQAGGLGRWSVQGTGQWRIGQQGTPPSYYIIQTANAESTLLWSDDPALPATHPDQPGNWTDYRLNVYLRSSSNSPLGVVFRYHDPTQYYRFTLEPQNNDWRLVRVVGGSITEQWLVNFTDPGFTYNQNRDYLITVEAIGSALHVSQDGALLFAVTDNAVANGRIGLYCAGNTSARFTDVRVDDFRATAPVVYRFAFTTS